MTNPASYRLCRQLFRLTHQLPRNVRDYYKGMILSSFRQFQDESDKARIADLHVRAVDMTHWVLVKYGKTETESARLMKNLKPPPSTRT